MSLITHKPSYEELALTLYALVHGGVANLHLAETNPSAMFATCHWHDLKNAPAYVKHAIKLAQQLDDHVLFTDTCENCNKRIVRLRTQTEYAHADTMNVFCEVKLKAKPTRIKTTRRR